MSPLEQLRATQHDDRISDSDVDLEQFLNSRHLATVLNDLEPTTAGEREQLARARNAA